MNSKVLKFTGIFGALFLVFCLAMRNVPVYSQDEPPPVDIPDGYDDYERRSSNANMFLPAELLALPMAEPASTVNTSGDPDFVNEVEMYDAATGEISRSAIPPTENHEGTQMAAPFQGLLPQGTHVDPDLQEFFDPETVIGTDGRSRITSTTSFPWRTLVRLYVSYGTSQFICSGAIIDDFHVLTAGHCVYDHSFDSWASSIRVVPGQDDDYTPYGSAYMTYMRSYTGWTVDGDWNHDWAVITLDRNIGKFTGWMGRQTNSTGSSIYPGTKNVAGYPGDLGSGCCMYFDADSTHSVTENRHYYYMDTAGGMSGSPVWRISGDSRYILSVHAYGFNNSSAIQANSGTRLNQDKYDRIVTWLGQDTAPADKADLIDDGAAYSGFYPSVVDKGTTFTSFNDVRNIGTKASGSFYVSYYASLNTIISSGDYYLGGTLVSSINPFTYDDASLTLAFPNSVPPGSYYIGWIIDSTGAINEFDEGNNTAYRTSKVTVNPSTPTNVQATDGTELDSVIVSWNAVSEAAEYKVYRANSASGAKTLLSTTAATTYTDNSALPGVVYYYFIRSKTGSFESGYSTFATGFAKYKVYLPMVIAE